MLQSVLSFVSSHAVVMSAAGVAVLDLIFAVNPAAASNGVLHYIYLKLGGKVA